MFGLQAARRTMRISCNAPVIALALAACDRGPSPDEIQAAYQDHLKHDATEAALFGVPDNHPGYLIRSDQRSCEDDGAGHYHCIVRFAVDFKGKRTTLDRSLHLVAGEHGWEVDTVEDVIKD